MSAIDVAALNTALAALSKNGRAEIGLEVGADPILSPNECIQVPSASRSDSSCTAWQS